jgi:hypothetical protein
MFEKLKGQLLAAMLSLLVSTGAAAAPATYRFVGDIVGLLAGVPVSGLLTLNVTGNTDDITMPSAAHLLNTLGGATFDLASVGSFTVTNSAYVFSRPDLGRVGFGVQGLTNCCDIIQIGNAALAGYDLRDSIGPLSGPDNPSLFDWVDVPTTAGLFTVRTMTNNTFEAIIDGTVPEPGTPALLTVAAAAAWFASRRRKPTRPAGLA